MFVMNNQLQRSNTDWMVVYLTYNLADAHIVAGRLESEGVPTFIHREPGASALGIHIGRMGEIKVLVRPADFDLAEAILYPEEPDQLPDDIDRLVFGDIEASDDNDQTE
jgi:hypothetical protein